MNITKYHTEALRSFDDGSLGPKNPEILSLRKLGWVHKTRMQLTAAGRNALAELPPRAPAVVSPADLPDEPAPVKLTVTGVLVDGALVPIETVCITAADADAFYDMSRADRVAAMMTENRAVRAWRDGGSDGSPPPSPVYARFLLEQHAHGGKAPRAKTTTRAGHPDEAAIVERITTMRGQGMGWPAIAKAFNAEGVATAKGGSWHSSTVMGIAKRHGLPTTIDGVSRTREVDPVLLARLTSLRDDGKGWPAIAKQLNDDQVPTANGGRWHASTVMGIAKRAGLDTARKAS